MCQGSEANLLMCEHNARFDTNCDHSEDAAVICGGNEGTSVWARTPFDHLSDSAEASCLDGSVRLSNNELSRFDLIKEEVARGRVEICVNGSYGTVLDESWEFSDASVVCRQMRLSPNGNCVQGK